MGQVWDHLDMDMPRDGTRVMIAILKPFQTIRSQMLLYIKCLEAGRACQRGSDLARACLKAVRRLSKRGKLT